MEFKIWVAFWSERDGPVGPFKDVSPTQGVS